MKDIKDFYPKYKYTPMPEMHNENIPVTSGCSFNQCKYCYLHGSEKFKIFEMNDIKAYIKETASFYKGKSRIPTKFTLLGGNPLCAPTSFLLEILEDISMNFEDVKYVSSFARSGDILNKSLEDLRKLKKAGINRLSIGIESGSNQVLNFQKKGVSAEEQEEALMKLKAVGIDYTCYIMIGLGGKKWTEEHALKTAELLNKVHPKELTIVTMVLFKGSELVEEVRKGNFKRLKVYETILEERLLLENLKLKTLFNGTHPTNAVSIKGYIPESKDLLLEKLDITLKEYYSRDLSSKEFEKWSDIIIR